MGPGTEMSTDKDGHRIEGSFVVKSGLAQMSKGGLIMDVVNAEQAKIAEEAGACAVMALERVPADIRRDGGVSRMSDPKLIKEIMAAVTIPVFAKVRIGHFAEAQILEALGVDMIDESEVLTPADDEHHVDKRAFKVPFVCGARNLGEALRRIAEGAAMIRTKGEAGTERCKVKSLKMENENPLNVHRWRKLEGNDPSTMEMIQKINFLQKLLLKRHQSIVEKEALIDDKDKSMDDSELFSYAKQIQVPVDLLREAAKIGRLPVVNFAAGGLATPADVSLLMQLGVDGVFVGSGIFKSNCPKKRAHAMVQSVTHYKNKEKLAELSEDLGEPMVGINCDQLAEKWEGRESEMK
ncbi:hypothetical protein TCAL_15157 [Tigriopus californicus]|uniref:pyridoxal 5'-phosphate synthase (glutamine hydrolyzing) n=1 Tax=Tigriopus californicus TaxID=6832 RepID=A0A553NVU4_TIGCA|nr:hypothetical protein TCAL_15157 [Tigriopus californicus]